MNQGILLAEDSEDDQIIFRSTLKKCGVTNPLVIVQDGRLAIAHLETCFSQAHSPQTPPPVPGVLFLDLRMPNCDGFEVLRWIHSRPEGKGAMLVIVMSAMDGVGDVRYAYELGADTFLSKPFTAIDMLHLVETFPGYWMRTTPSATLTPWQHLSPEPEHSF